MVLTNFNPDIETEAVTAFNNVVKAHDANVQAEVAAGTMDAFQMLQHMEDFVHVASKTIPSKFDLPKQATTNTAGLVKLYEVAGSNTDGTMTQKAIRTVYATKTEIPSVWDENGHLVSPDGHWDLWVSDN